MGKFDGFSSPTNIFVIFNFLQCFDFPIREMEERARENRSLPNDIVGYTIIWWRFHVKMNTFESNDFITLDESMGILPIWSTAIFYLQMFTFIDRPRIEKMVVGNLHMVLKDQFGHCWYQERPLQFLKDIYLTKGLVRLRTIISPKVIFILFFHISNLIKLER